MGRSRRKYDDSQDAKHDNNSNQTILPSKRQKSLKKKINPVQPRKLTKKQKKKLEKVLESKKKKEKRSELLSRLSTVQVTATELALMDSVAHIGTKNSKLSTLSKRPLPMALTEAIKSPQDLTHYPLNSIKVPKGKGKRRKLSKKKKHVNKIDQNATPENTDNSNGEDDDSSLTSASDEECEKEQTKIIEPTLIKEKDTTDKPIVGVSQNNNTVESSTEKIKTKPTISDMPTINKDQSISKSVTYVHLDRSQKIQESRLALPILAEEQVIMEVITANSIVIVCGETGSGKTTQVPQFLYEAGYATAGMIGITEPRRVAAVSMSKRVAKEMNLPAAKVSYHIRYENNVTKDTQVKFMTDGVLTREMKEDFLLTKYSVIILDEAHERTANTDVLIGLLSRIVPLREKKGNPLKLIIMSATLRIEDFTENQRLFKKAPPLCKIDVRQFPVTIHFNKKTPSDDPDDKHHCPYLSETYNKICKIHRTLPSGGILVFVTGKQEIYALIRKLSNTFPSKPVEDRKANMDDKSDIFDMPNIDLNKYATKPQVEYEKEEYHSTKELQASDDEGDSDSEIFLDDSIQKDFDLSLPLHILPLYSLLPPSKQKLVFDEPPEGCRLCVIATNVAETSLTIPGVKYVVDCGKVKKRVYDKVTGISSFQVSWISKASADQRAGRAGRTDSGHAYRLYSSAVFQDFADHDLPEIAQKPVAGLVLQMKSMHIDRVVNFPFPTPPSRDALEGAENLLISLGTIEPPPKKATLKEIKLAKFSGKITELGKLVAAFPVHPRFGKMIALAVQKSHQNDVIPYVITVVAALTVRELFVSTSTTSDSNNNKEEVRHVAARLHHLKVLWSTVGGGAQRKAFGDLMVYLGAVGAAEYSGGSASYCASNCIRPKALLEIRKLRSQLTNTLNCAMPECDCCMDPKMSPPSEDQIKLLRQIVLSALGDQVARLLPKESLPVEQAKQMKGAYQCLLSDEPVFIHPESVLSRDPLPAFVTFHEIVKTESTKKRAYMRDVTEIESTWLATLCPQYCSFSNPLASPEPFYNPSTDDVMCHVTATYGRLAWKLGEVEVAYPPGLDRFRWFARFLLEGKVSKQLERFVSSLLSRPATMVKSWANLQPRTEVMLLALRNKNVDSKQKLISVWKTEPSYLRTAYLQWLPNSIHEKATAIWPPSD